MAATGSCCWSELKTDKRKRTPKQLKWAQLWRGPEVYEWRTP